MKKDKLLQQTTNPAGASGPAGRKKKLIRILGVAIITAFFGLGLVHMHSLPLVQEVKESFRQSGRNLSAYTYTDVEDFPYLKSRPGPDHTK
ncbi:hypothetical protein [Desulfonatronospira sp.]|uniref:hypothetical protein n=1 Tax=Desulfonatronospira sp. TaxID=1962951 RepID=UPI0025BB3D78|nr:hypothetical protein [Desulfonatronospira sp.]